MAIIYSYPLNDDIKPLDELVGTTEKNINGQLKTVTRNFLLQDLAEFFIVDGALQKTITLTTDGDSGPATLDDITGVLNIPDYSNGEPQAQIILTTNGPYGPATLIDNTLNIPDLGYTPVNVAGDIMSGILTLSEDPIEPLDAVTKQYVDRIQSGTYAYYVDQISQNKLLPERYYALTDYQHKYCIEETNTAPKKVFRTITFVTTGWLVLDGVVVTDLPVGTVVTINSLPVGYTGTLTIGSTTTVTQIDQNFYFKFANGMNNSAANVGVGIVYSYPRFSILTNINNATVYDTYGKIEMKPGGVLNTDVHDGTVYGDLTAAQNFTPPIEVIILKAKSTNSFYQDCASLTFLNDEMVYDFNANIVYNDNREPIGTRNGFISRRANKVLNIDIDKDWRAQRYRRWMVPVATGTSDYRKKLLNQDYANTNTYLAFQNKYIYTSELMTVNSTSNMYICNKIETTSLTAGETGSVTTFPIIMDGTGGVGSTEGIVKFKDYTIFGLTPLLEPIEVSNCIIDNLVNSVFINTNASNKGNLSITTDRYFINSTFFGYPTITGSRQTFENVNCFDRIELFGFGNSLKDINILSYLSINSSSSNFTNIICGSLPYNIYLTGMGTLFNNTPVRWGYLYVSLTNIRNSLIGWGTASIAMESSNINGGGIFHYGNSTASNVNSTNRLQILFTKFINANYNSYYSQNYVLDSVSLSTAQAKITQDISNVILKTDSQSALYYQNLDIVTPGNTVTKKYNFTTALFETITNPVSGTVTSITASSPLTGGTITTSGTIGIPAATNIVDGYITKEAFVTFTNKENSLPTVPVDGYVLSSTTAGARSWIPMTSGSLSPLTTKGDLYTFSTVNTRLPIGTDGQILTANSSVPEGLSWQDNYADWTSVVKHIVKNNGLSGTITKGTAVYVTSSNGTNMLVGRASNVSESTSSKTMGLMQSNITTTGGTQTGFVITEGLLEGLNTAGTTAGDPVWLGVDGALIYGLINKPYAPNHLVFIGIVTKVSAGNGEIFVKVQNGFELKELHDVQAQNPTLKDTLYYDNTVSPAQWKTASIPTVLGYTPQDTLQNTVNIKSINGNSILGSGDLTINPSTPSQSAFTILANNTNASAVPTEQVYKEVAQQSLSGTGMIATGGALPTGINTHFYRWSQVGNLVTVRINLQFATAGTCSGIAIPFANMPDIPQIPQHPSIYATALDMITFGSGSLAGNKLMGAFATGSGMSGIRIKTIGTPNTYEIVVGRASAAYNNGWIHVQYYI